jgi:hypothetical protein
MSKRNAVGDIVRIGSEESSPVNHGATGRGEVVVVPVSNEKRCPSTPTDDGIDLCVDSSDDEQVVAVSPSQQKERPPFTSMYKFIAEDVKVFTGKMHLYYNRPEDTECSTLAVGAYCELCDKTFKYNTVSNPQTVTKHARIFHAKEMAKLHRAQQKREEADARSKAKATGKNKIQTNLNNFTQSDASKFPLASAKELDIFRFKSAVWIGCRLLPFARVEDCELQDMIDYCCGLNKKRVTLPNRNQTSELIGCISSAIRDTIRESVKAELKYYALTTDMWTSKSMEAYMTTTMHYLTNNFELKQYTLDVCPFEGRHTGIKIGEKLSSTLFETWNLPKSRCAMMVRDSGSNIVKACNDIHLPHTPCIGHQMHLVLAPFLVEPKKPKKKKPTEQPMETTTEMTVPTTATNGKCYYNVFFIVTTTFIYTHTHVCADDDDDDKNAGPAAVLEGADLFQDNPKDFDLKAKLLEL